MIQCDFVFGLNLPDSGVDFNILEIQCVFVIVFNASGLEENHCSWFIFQVLIPQSWCK